MANGLSPDKADPQRGKSGRLLRTHHLLIAVVFAVIILGLLGVANIGMDILTSMRAYVGGEGLWSKGQKDAVLYLLRYANTRAESDYQRYLQAIAVPLADHDARVEMEQPRPDREKAGRALIAGHNHREDVDGMVNLFLRYHREPHIAHAIEVWVRADALLQNLRRLGDAMHAELNKPAPDPWRIAALTDEIDGLNEQFPELEDDFSRSLGDAARNARSIVFNVLAAGALVALLLGLFVSYRLIVRARDADEQYRHLFETAGDAIIIADHETGEILDANVKLTELTGIPAAKLIGARQPDLFGREIPSVHGGSDVQSGDLVIRHVSGASIPVDVRTGQGRFCSRSVDYSVVRDIRERRAMEEQLREAARMESVGRLAGGVAHDFNNLLTVIAGYAQALKRNAGESTRDKVDQILGAADRAGALVRQLLAFSRKQPLDPRIIDLNALIRNVTDLVRGVLGEQIELRLELTSSLGAVEADPRQIEQILMNLAANARDAIPDSGVVVIGTWNDDSGPAPQVGFSVMDTGHGMDEATVRRVFEPFFTTKPQGKGTGLGLAMVYGTVKQSRGRIFVESAPGQGTTFRILLPRASAEPSGGAETAGVASAQGRETVLLVEDDAGVREVLAHGLEEEGYTVVTAPNGRAAIETYRSDPARFAVIVTDIVMPEMGGIAMGEALRASGAAVPIVYATGYHQDLEKYTAAQLPLSAGLVLKPFSPQTLASAIQQALSTRVAAAPVR